MKAIMIVIIAALSLCLALGSCHGKRTSDYRLKMADAIMNSTPDSALALLKTINRDSLDEELQAWHALLYTKATDKCYRPIADDSLISRAVDYSRVEATVLRCSRFSIRDTIIQPTK